MGSAKVELGEKGNPLNFYYKRKFNILIFNLSFLENILKEQKNNIETDIIL